MAIDGNHGTVGGKEKLQTETLFKTLGSSCGYIK